MLAKFINTILVLSIVIECYVFAYKISRFTAVQNARKKQPGLASPGGIHTQKEHNYDDIIDSIVKTSSYIT